MSLVIVAVTIAALMWWMRTARAAHRRAAARSLFVWVD